MKKTNIKKNVFLAVLLTLTSMFLINDKIKEITNEPDYDIIVSPGNESDDIALNANEIKFKNIGDEFILSAKINTDATYQNLEFVSSDENKVSVKRISSTSCKLTKLDDFLELVTITVTTEDPFDDISATCSVRAYNRLYELDGDLEWNCYLDDKEKEYDNANEIVLVNGAKYKFIWTVSTIFGQYKYEEEYPNTYCFIEDEDLEFLQNEIERVFGNNITNFYVDDESYNNFHLLRFEIIYENNIFEDIDEIDVDISIYETSTSWTLLKYKPVNNITFEDSLFVL